MEIEKFCLNNEIITSEDKKWILDTVQQTVELNPNADVERVGQILYSYVSLKHITRGKGVKVECRLFEPTGSMGYISVTGKKIDYCNSNLFRKITLLATNFEAYSKTDGTVQINFTFHKLKRKK